MGRVRIALIVSAGLGFGLGLGASACVVINPHHCDNLAPDPNVWCVNHYDDRPYCSPCAADYNGCVSEEPSEDECPQYSRPAGTETGETETGETETG
ncbi:MAG TPA: hypothetical protein VK034_31260 [Enhygromyxa sp.]|nr:hypothetical protein [Enhygromyxa sp.]